MRALSALFLACLLACGLLTVDTDLSPWAAPSLTAPLGADEFGRNLLMTLLVATGRSLVFGVLLAGVTIGLAILAAQMSRRSIALRTGLKLLTNMVESVPIYLWVLAAFVTFGGSLVVAAVVLVIATLPTMSSVIAGELERLEDEPYVAVARLQGRSSLSVLARHILPNAMDVVTPLFLQIVGVALAIPGAVGVLGFSRRTSYDLGTLLLRGKENVAAHPSLLVGALAALVLVYLCLETLRRPAKSIPRALPTIA